MDLDVLMVSRILLLTEINIIDICAFAAASNHNVPN